jgi:hypothetical protein
MLAKRGSLLEKSLVKVSRVDALTRLGCAAVSFDSVCFLIFATRTYRLRMARR